MDDFDFQDDLSYYHQEGLVIIHRYIISENTSMFEENVDDFTTAAKLAPKPISQAVAGLVSAC